MAYNIANWGSIAGNAGPIWVGISFSNGQDKGAQFMQANPETPGTELVSYEHEIDYYGNQKTYWFKLKNTGAQPTSFTLCGGGLS